MSGKSIQNIGIDAGNSKITIAQTDHMMVPCIVPDMMDMRNIPNLVMFLKDSDELRKFGNAATYGKSFHLPGIPGCDDKKSLLTKTNISMGRSTYQLPIFIIKNMIMSHVKKIISSRYPDQHNDHFVIVPSYSDSACNMYFDALGAGCIIVTESKNNLTERSNHTIVNISDINAIIFCYLNKYMFTSVKTLIPRTCVLIIDMGHKKTNFILFDASKKDNNIMVQQKTTLISNTISGCTIDDLLCEYVAERIVTSYPVPESAGSQRKESSTCKSHHITTLCQNNFFRSAIIKLKHQLSINNVVKFTFDEKYTDTLRDIMISVNRSELEHLMEQKRMDTILNEMLDMILKITNKHIDCVELIGGTSRIPMLKKLIETKMHPVSLTLNPDETVALGASFYGHLLNNKNHSLAKSLPIPPPFPIPVQIDYQREVRRTVCIQYNTEYDSTNTVCPFEKFQSVISTFNMSQGDVEERARMNCKSEFSENTDTVIVRICSLSNTFKIIIEDLTIEVIMVSYLKTKHIDVCVTYNMNDLIDIINIKDTMGNNITFEQKAYNNTDNINTYPLGNKFTCMFTPNENMFIEIEKLNDRRYEVINFMEGYYYDSDSANKLMQKISQTHNIPYNIQSSDVSSDVSLGERSKYKSPLKEVFEFYKFCQGYTKDPETEMEIKFNQYIKDTIHTEHGLGKIEEAINIIKKIRNDYMK